MIAIWRVANSETDREFARFEFYEKGQYEAFFDNDHIAKMFQEIGIQIPPTFSSRFKDKKVVVIGDKEFPDAFVEVYMVQNKMNEQYRVEKKRLAQ